MTLLTRNRVPRLHELATAKLLTVPLLIEDFGDCPFHVAEPILARMSAKQLAAIETKCPQLMPELDVLWQTLLKKDFPNRACSSRDSTAHALRNRAFMPHKSLYQQYSADRDALQKDSTERLRRVTERIHLQKAANKVVAVAQHLQEPTVRRRHGEYGSTRSPIFLKAKRELQERMLMFRGHREPSNPHSPAHMKHPRSRAYENHQKPSRAKRLQNFEKVPVSGYGNSAPLPSRTFPATLPSAPITAQPTTLSATFSGNATMPHRGTFVTTSLGDHTSKSPSYSNTSHEIGQERQHNNIHRNPTDKGSTPACRPPPERAVPVPISLGDPPIIVDCKDEIARNLSQQEIPCTMQDQDKQILRSRSEGQQTAGIAAATRFRKRKPPQPSIFLNPKRRQLPPLKHPSKARRTPMPFSHQDLSIKPMPAPSRIKAIRSSIFR